MRTNTEIEFKTAISKEQYNKLIKKLELENNIYKQINYYFDTADLDLLKKKIVLRIRNKKETLYKLTLKSSKEHECYEEHVFLTEAEANCLINDGFNTEKYYNFACDVKYKGKLENFRVRFPYKSGTLFLDECIYNGKVDYEIEFEVPEYNLGKKEFFEFLESENIVYTETKHKSDRVLL